MHNDMTGAKLLLTSCAVVELQPRKSHMLSSCLFMDLFHPSDLLIRTWGQDVDS